MNNVTKLMAGLCLATGIFSNSASAAVDDNVIFERVATVRTSDQYVEKIVLTEDTQYTLTLTDFAFPDALDSLGVTLISANRPIASIVMESSESAMPGNSAFGTTRNPVFGSNVPGKKHSWGGEFQQESISGFLEAGTYYLSMYAEFDAGWFYDLGSHSGLYSAQMIATPVPASVLLMLSGLGALGMIRKKASDNRLAA